jgi:hypothetical protein
VTEISVEIQKKIPILPYKWLFWCVFNFHILNKKINKKKTKEEEAENSY